MSYALSIDLVQPFDEVVPQVKQALADNGFGIITEIDMQKTLKNKIDVEIGPHLILGACNPQFAHRALKIEPSIGLLLPCNVVLYEESEGHAVVGSVDPMQTLAGAAESTALAELARNVTVKLERALARL